MAGLDGPAPAIDCHAHAVLEGLLGAAGEAGPELGQDADGRPWFRVGDRVLCGVGYRGTAFMDPDLRPGPAPVRRAAGPVRPGAAGRLAHEETLAVATLVFGGVLHRHPDLDVSLSHGGGAAPFLAGRLRQGGRDGAAGPRHERRRLGPGAGAEPGELAPVLSANARL